MLVVQGSWHFTAAYASLNACRGLRFNSHSGVRVPAPITKRAPDPGALSA